MKEALFYTKTSTQKVHCQLCPHQCSISPDKSGICKVRKNINGTLYTEVYEKFSSIHVDPIEKKPLYHYFPGSSILSLGSVGCNLSCTCCQNWTISQASAHDFPLQTKAADEIITMALKQPNNIGIAYTYNEPTVWYESMVDIAKKAKAHQLKNVMVSNGFINAEPLSELCRYMDAFNIDLKGFTEDFYKRVAGASLSPIKETLLAIVKNKKHLEITYLVIPRLNDDPNVFEEMVTWIARKIGKNAILHLSRYFPNYKMNIESTPLSTLSSLYAIAKKHLHYVYLGNVMMQEGKDTLCPTCNHVLIERDGYSTELTGITKEGNCIQCGHSLSGDIIIT